MSKTDNRMQFTCPLSPLHTLIRFKCIVFKKNLPKKKNISMKMMRKKTRLFNRKLLKISTKGNKYLTVNKKKRSMLRRMNPLCQKEDQLNQ